MRSIKDDCGGEAADMSNDQITTTLHPSSLLLDRNISTPEVKDTLSSEHSNLRLSEAHEDVPSDPFVFSTDQLKGNEVSSYLFQIISAIQNEFFWLNNLK